jgi:hypothetical protein
MARFSSRSHWPIDIPLCSWNILTPLGMRSALYDAHILFASSQWSDYLITCIRCGRSHSGMTISRATGKRSRSALRVLSDSRPFLLLAPPKGNIACGNDATGNIPSGMKASSKTHGLYHYDPVKHGLVKRVPKSTDKAVKNAVSINYSSFQLHASSCVGAILVIAQWGRGAGRIQDSPLPLISGVTQVKFAINMGKHELFRAEV